MFPIDISKLSRLMHSIYQVQIAGNNFGTEKVISHQSTEFNLSKVLDIF